jgi:hypothetical protein
MFEGIEKRWHASEDTRYDAVIVAAPPWILTFQKCDPLTP